MYLRDKTQPADFPSGERKYLFPNRFSEKIKLNRKINDFE
jgi:hypothetical protein